MEGQFVTSDPVIYSVVVALVFVFTSLVFMLYGKNFVRGVESRTVKTDACVDSYLLPYHLIDWLVERRQKKVMDKAVKSIAVVSSLFPESVLDRLFPDKRKELKRSKSMVWKNDEAEHSPSITDFLDGRKPTNKVKPIADKFENVTVLFADLAGFTKWSSSREPEQVFELLETLYGAFDKIALRRQVFKVETIGDW
jgi:hypothetical protein